MLACEDVSFSYSKGLPILRDVSLVVGSSDRLWLRAPSGAGKTTLCKLLSGYLTPDTGSISVDRSPLAMKGACQVQLIGQHPERMLDPRMRMRDSLEEASSDKGRIELLADELGIRSEWMGRFPHELSGGELQRFCIARALLADPRYLIADEISTMLDACTQARIWKVLLAEAERRDMGMVLTTHSEALARRLATRQFVLPEV